MLRMRFSACLPVQGTLDCKLIVCCEVRCCEVQRGNCSTCALHCYIAMHCTLCALCLVTLQCIAQCIALVCLVIVAQLWFTARPLPHFASSPSLSYLHHHDHHDDREDHDEHVCDHLHGGEKYETEEFCLGLFCLLSYFHGGDYNLGNNDHPHAVSLLRCCFYQLCSFQQWWCWWWRKRWCQYKSYLPPTCPGLSYLSKKMTNRHCAPLCTSVYCTPPVCI